MIHPDIWTKAVMKDLQAEIAAGRSIVIVDARFQNDRNNLHEWFGAHRVHITSTLERASTGENWRAHASENDLPNSEDIDFTFINNEEYPFPTMGEKVDFMFEVLHTRPRD